LPIPAVAGDDEDAAAGRRRKRFERLAAQAELARSGRRAASRRPVGRACVRLCRGGPRPPREQATRRGGSLFPFTSRLGARRPTRKSRSTARWVASSTSTAPGSGRRLQPRRDVHRVTERGRNSTRDPAPTSPHRPTAPVAASDPDAEALGAPATPHLAPVLLHLADDSERASGTATLGVVPPASWAHRRRRELRRPARSLTWPPSDSTSPTIRATASHDDELHVLGIEPLRERGFEPTDVGEDGPSGPSAPPLTVVVIPRGKRTGGARIKPTRVRCVRREAPCRPPRRRPAERARSLEAAGASAWSRRAVSRRRRGAPAADAVPRLPPRAAPSPSLLLRPHLAAERDQLREVPRRLATFVGGPRCGRRRARTG